MHVQVFLPLLSAAAHQRPALPLNLLLLLLLLFGNFEGDIWPGASESVVWKHSGQLEKVGDALMAPRPPQQSNANSTSGNRDRVREGSDYC
jgi:hypothetical protein